MTSEEKELLREVPDALQRLIRYVTRGFYGLEHGLVIDVLVRNACVKEEDIQELMKFDKKQLRAILEHLKKDKFLKSRLCVETKDEKVTKHNYYYINYRSISNIIKYKLHHVQKKIETQERDLTNRASFKCPTCLTTYTDLEVKLLVDPYLETLNCTFCKSEVEEDVAAEEAQDTRTLQAKFNEQTEPIYKLLQDTENITLSNEVLEPEPTIIPHLHPNAKRSAPKLKNAGDRWADVRKSGVDYHQDITINIGDDANAEQVSRAKEIPIWMQQSTVTNNSDTSAAISSISEGIRNDPSTSNARDSPHREGVKKTNNEVLEMLMLQERGSKSASNSAVLPGYNEANNNDDKSDASDSDEERARRMTYGQQSHAVDDDEDDDDDDDDDFEDVDDSYVVMVAGKPYSYSEVEEKGQKLVQLMSAEEKNAYIQIGQQIYEDMHD